MRYFAIVLVSCLSMHANAQMDVQEFGGSIHSNWCNSSTANSVCSDTGNLYWLVYQNGLCANGSTIQYTCRVRNSNPCPAGLTWNQNIQNCVDPNAPCPVGQLKFNGVCADVGECDTGEQVVLDNGQSLLQACDGAEQCDEGFYWHSATQSCYGPDDQGSSSSDSSSSDSSSSDSSSSDGSTSSSGDGGSTSDGSGGSTSSGSEIDLSEVVSELNEANEHLQDISDSLDGDGASFDGSVSPGVQSLYESEYPNGVAGVWESQKTALMDTPIFGFMNQFQFDYNDTSLPVWSMCFDLGSVGNFGCKDLTVPAYVWAFVKIVMLVSTAFLCRRLIFGG